MSQDLSAPITWLHSKGAFDEFLTAIPEKTFFKHVYSRHTNYSWSDVQINPVNKPEYDSDVRFVLPRIGDLVTKMYLYYHVSKLNYGTLTVQVPRTGVTIAPMVTVALDARRVPRSGTTDYDGKTHDDFMDSWMDHMGYVLTERVELWVGNTLIESVTGDFMYVWDSLIHNQNNSVVLNTPNDNGGKHNIGTQHDQHIYVPLKFFFDESQGHALPIAALQYHEVEVRVKLSPKPLMSSYLKYYDKEANNRYVRKDVPLYYEDSLKALVVDPGQRKLKDLDVGGDLKRVSLITRYVFLDTFEREQFAKSRNSWLITETQHLSVPIKASDKLFKEISLDKFSGPCKEIIFFYRADYRSITGVGEYVDNSQFWKFDANHRRLGKEELVDTGNGYLTPVGWAEWPQIDDTLFETATLAINGNDLWSPPRDPLWFGFYMPFEFHTNGPTENFNQNLYVMPFCFKPESQDPNGSINLSKIDRLSLKLTFKGVPGYKDGAVLSDGHVNIYARTMNMFEVHNGHGRKVFL